MNTGTALPLTASAPRAPEPSVDRIEELANRILIGDILLPKFQREFVWARIQILDLLDSIVNNYPIGSVLLWRTRAELRNERSIADLDIAATRQDYPVNYLLDGQQRLSTICGVLFWHGSDPNSKWNIAYDLRDRRFIQLKTLDDPPLHQIRLHKLPDAAAYFQQVSSFKTLTAADTSLLENNANELFTRFKDYKVASVTLHDMPIGAVAPIFERINSRGTQLTMVDLMRAATWSEDFDLIDAIDEIRSALEDKDFGGIERKAILRSISATAGGGFSEGSIDDLRKHSSELLKKAVAVTKEAYRKSVDFLVTELRIPTDTQLPYVNQIVVLVEHFRLIPEPNAAQYGELSRWFWQTALSGYFGGWNTGNMAADQDAAKRFANGEAASMDVGVRNPGPAVWTAQQFRANAAHAKLLALMLAFRNPIDLLTGQNIDVHRALAQSNRKEFHHFFPRDYLTKSRGVTLRKSNLLANIIMLTATSNKTISNKAPSDYLKDVEKNLGMRFKEALRANLISENALGAARDNDYDAFLRERSNTLAEAASELTGWR